MFQVFINEISKLNVAIITVSEFITENDGTANLKGTPSISPVHSPLFSPAL